MTDATGASTPAVTPKRPINMGIGRLGDPNVIFKPRKFRWTFKVVADDGREIVGEQFCKAESRPKLAVEEVEVKKPDQDPVEETEINFLSSKTWVPGKGTWEPITLRFSVKADEEGLRENADFFGWLATVYDFAPGDGKLDWNILLRDDEGDLDEKKLKHTVLLNLYDGCGVPLETWRLGGAFPKGVAFDSFDYSDGYTNVELRLKFDRCVYENKVSTFPWTPVSSQAGSTAPSPGCTEGEVPTPKA